MTITISDEGFQLAQSKAKAAGFPDVVSYLENHFRSNGAPDPLDELDWSCLPDSMKVRNRAELEEKLREAAESLDRGEGIPATPEYFTAVHERAKRAAGR